MVRLLGVAFATCAVAFSASATMPAAQPGLPPRLDQYITSAVDLTAAERDRLLGGSAVTKLLPADESKEVAVFGAVWINAPIHRYVEAVKDIENLEKGRGFRTTKRISSPPQAADFAQLRLPGEDIDDLRSCRVGACQVKLGEHALERFRSEIDWAAPDARQRANALMRRIAMEYVNGYLEGGNKRLAVYRDRARPTLVAAEFRAMVDQMPVLTTFMPNMHQYLLDYPNVQLPGATSFLYWQETEFGLKPTIRISHLTIRENPGDTVVASKMLYATHYFWTALELRTLMPDKARGNGFWFATVSRSRLDGLSGFTGIFVRRRVRSGVQKGSLTVLETTKRMLERGR